MIKRILISSSILIVAMVSCGMSIQLLGIKVHSDVMSDAMAMLSIILTSMVCGIVLWNVNRWTRRAMNG